MIRKSITALTIALALVGAVALGMSLSKPANLLVEHVAVHDDPPARTFWMKRVCEYEDSMNCAWNAKTDGLANGGRSSYTRRLPDGTECIFFVNRKYAKKHDKCFTRAGGM